MQIRVLLAEAFQSPEIDIVVSRLKAQFPNYTWMPDPKSIVNDCMRILWKNKYV